MAVANQRIVNIRTPKVGVEGKAFVQVDLSDLQAASRDLSPAQVIIYMDLCGNKDGFKYEYSPAYYEEYYGVSKKTAQRAFTELEEKGYITKENGKYYFNRKPIKNQI